MCWSFREKKSFRQISQPPSSLIRVAVCIVNEKSVIFIITRIIYTRSILSTVSKYGRYIRNFGQKTWYQISPCKQRAGDNWNLAGSEDGLVTHLCKHFKSVSASTKYSLRYITVIPIEIFMGRLSTESAEKTSSVYVQNSCPVKTNLLENIPITMRRFIIHSNNKYTLFAMHMYNKPIAN